MLYCTGDYCARLSCRDSLLETRTLDIPVILPDYYEDCARCLDRLLDALLSLDGVKRAEIDSEHQSVSLTYDANVITLEQIKDRTKRLGVEIAKHYTHEALHLEGLDCPDCAMKLERSIGRMKGVLWSSVNYATSILSVEYEQTSTHHQAIVDRVRDLGYDVTPPASETDEGQPRSRSFWLTRKAVFTTVAGAFLAAALIERAANAGELVTTMLFAVSIVAGGYFPARAGILSLRALTMDTNFLVSLAAVGAIYLQRWDEAAGVLFLFSLGSALEAYTVDKARKSIRSMIGLSPKEATVLRHGHEDRVKVENVRVGDTILIRPGERMPLDGVVTSGVSGLDESAVTGESVPKEKFPGAQVYAGSINQRGALEVRVTSVSGDDTLSRIIQMVEEAQARKAPSQQFSERFGRIYTPIVVVLAFGIGILSLVFGNDIWLTRALVLLVVACPCALVISTPVAVVAAIANAAKHGVLIKGGAYLEALGAVSVVAFDKTGTLTSGQMAVTDVVAFDGSESDVLRVAASIESRSEHPLAEAILTKASEERISISELSDFEALPGFGARGVVNGRVSYVGNGRLLDTIKVVLPENSAVSELRSEGKTLVFVVSEEKVVGVVAAADTERGASREVLLSLKNDGVSPTVMLTGDNSVTAQAVARRLGVDLVEAELLPEEKVERVRSLIKRHGKVAMVGDGINDAPALAAATIGVAMGGAGSHVAIETADVALMSDDLSMLPYAMKLSRSALRIIKQNIAFSVAVVIALVSLTLVGHLDLTKGIVGHEASALLVIANSMRLLGRRPQ